MHVSLAPFVVAPGASAQKPRLRRARGTGIFGLSRRAVVRVAEALGVASLFFWGAFAARRSGLPRGRQWLWATIYGLLGVGIILIELAFTH